MDEPSAPLPSLDEYVVARGSDLLRVAQLLTGDRRRAEQLVETALGKALPHWRHLVAREPGHHDAELRRLVVTSFTAGRGRSRDEHPVEPATRSPEQRAADAAALRGEVLRALARLSRVQRAVVVLRYFEDLTETQAADALDRSPAAVRSQGASALAALPPALASPGSGPADPQWRLRDALEQAVPSSPDASGLADGARRYAARVRRRRRAVALSLASVALALVGAVALPALRDMAHVPSVPEPTPTAPPTLAFQFCLSPDVPVVQAQRDGRPLSERYDALVVCARTDQDSVWTGSLPPDDVLDVPQALDTVRLEPRDRGSGCPALPSGPAFRVLVRSPDGAVGYLPNEALRCNGWPALATYFVAVAEQRADPADDRLDGSYLGCPPAWKERAGGPASLPRGTALATATLCLHPLAEQPLTAVPRLRQVRGLAFGDVQVAPLNAELADHGTARGRPAPCPQKLWRYVLRGVTTDGELVELAGSCPERLELVSAPGTTMRFGPDAASLLRGGVLGS